MNPTMYPETAAEWLSDWDAGRNCWTLEMGGIGPGYEQCIQIACAEIIRDMHAEPVPNTEAERKAWSEKADAALHRADKFPGMGMSGAQAGAARALAFQFCTVGPRAFFVKLKADHPERAEDMILVDRGWPQAGDEVKP